MTNKINEQDDYTMNMDEEEEDDFLLDDGDDDVFNMDMDDDSDDSLLDDSEDSDVPQAVDQSEGVEVSLNTISDFYFALNSTEGIEFKTLRHTYFDLALAEKAEERNINHEDLLLYASEEDARYLDLIEKMYEVPTKAFIPNLQPQNRDILLELLTAVTMPLFQYVDSKNKGDIEGDIRSHVPLVSPEEDVDGDDLDIDMMSVDNVVSTIMNIYESLYAPCFINKPQGVLTSNGILAFREDGTWGIVKNGRTFMKPLYENLDDALGNYLGDGLEESSIGSHCFKSNGDLVKTYTPVYHLYNINGIKADGTKVDSWVDFADYLREDVRQKVKNVLTRISAEDSLDVQRNLISLFTNCVIVEDFDVNKALSLIYKVGIDTGDRVQRLFSTRLNAIFAKPFGQMISCSEDDFRVGRLFFVFDMNAYASEVLFSYKSYENLIRSGNKPSISRVVVGKNLDGTDYTVNLNADIIKVIGIQGASRSGKGVLTLNVLATMYGEGCPVMYLDFKPDMASALWEMERYFNSQGHDARLFSIDGKDGFKGNSKSPRYYPFSRGLPDGLPFHANEFTVVPYLKAIQLFCLATLVRTRGAEGYDTSKKLFIIMDEIQGFSRKTTPFFARIRDYLTKLSKEKGRGNTEANPLEDYLNKFLEAFDSDIGTQLSQVRDVTGGTGNAAMILIGQKVKPAEWSFEVKEAGKSTTKNLEATSSFAYRMLISTNIKFIGKNAGTGTIYGITKLRIPGASLVDDEKIMGYWVSTSDAQPKDDSSKVFKSYLTLNDNDFNADAFRRKDWKEMPFTGGVLKNMDESTQKRIIEQDLMDKGTVRDSIGILGLMRMIAGGDDATLAKNMSAGYILMDKLFRDLGLASRFETVEEYLHDCSPDSIFTFAELEGMFGNAQNQVSDVDLMGDSPSGVSQPSWANATVLEDNPSVEVNPNLEDEDEDLGDSDFDEIAENAFPNQTAPQRIPVIPIVPPPVGRIQPDVAETLDAPTWQSNIATDDELGVFERGNSTLDEDIFSERETHHSEPTINQTPPIQQAPQKPLNVHAEHGHSAQPINQQMGYSNVYSEPMKIENNPFKNTRAKSNMTTAYALKVISKQIVKQIEQMLGSLDRVETFEATSTGLVINGYAFRPKFDKEFIELLPFDIQQDIARGNLTPLFDFDAVYSFKHLDTFIIDNTRLAEGRIKRELQLPNKMTWYKLLQRKKFLKRIVIAGQEITDRESCDIYENGGKAGYELEEQLSDKFQMRPFKETPLGKLWQTRPAKIATGALGATAGVKAVMVGVSIFGGWGLLFGAFAGYGAYRKYVKK